MPFIEATRDTAFLKFFLGGVAGAGKTYSAIQLGSLLAANGDRSLVRFEDGKIFVDPSVSSKVCVIDTERGRSRKYAGGKPFRFALEELSTFEPAKYVDAIREAERARFRVCIIDTLSHAWAGTGGTLETVTAAGSAFQAWKEPSKAHDRMISAIVDAQMHMIICMRAKHKSKMVDGENGKKVVVKLPLDFIQRQDIEFEGDIIGMMHEAKMKIMKSSCPSILLGEIIDKPGEELSDRLIAWLDRGSLVSMFAKLKDEAETISSKEALAAFGAKMKTKENQLTQKEIVLIQTIFSRKLKEIKEGGR